MSKRFIIPLLIAAFTLAPATILADDTLASPAPTPNPASGLGPQSTTQAGGSSADAASLQPAGLSPLQSTTSDATGLTAPNASALQAPTTSDALRVLAGEADGAPHQTDGESGNLWGWLWFSLGFGLIAILGWLAYRYRGRFLKRP
ncbi:MAG: hypothetical protein JWN01_275 [Patescibacteria group bacterium]|nr:hypothetical protein [Patescibacteria group bacterium]